LIHHNRVAKMSGMVMGQNITQLAIDVASLQTESAGLTAGLDELWHLTCGTFVFLMQAGFAMLEAGVVKKKNAINILFKSMVDPCISGIFFYLLGFGFAYGKTKGGFIGTSKFALADDAYDIGDGTDQLDYHTFFFQWTFAAATVTIVSGAVAERCKLEAYFIYAIVAVTWIYPVVVHWAWGDGWLSPFAAETDDYLLYGADDGSNGYIDFAGSGVVHMVGGLLGLCGAIALGPRKGRFGPDGTVNYADFKPHNVPLMTLGGFILWVGWYGFNPGSTLCMAGGCSKLAAKVATTTTISAAAAGCTMICIQMFQGVYDLSAIVNSVLAGLVSVTGPCACIDPWAALLIGISGCLVFMGASAAMLALQIDDPLDAFAVHGACGAWGVLNVAIFGNDDNAAFAGYAGSASGQHPIRTGEQFAVQLIALVTIGAWTLFFGFLTFYGIKFTIGLRVPPEVEEEGLDASEHGGQAYESEGMKGAPVAVEDPADKSVEIN
jgi:Amt family ammonium transporter